MVQRVVSFSSQLVVGVYLTGILLPSSGSAFLGPLTTPRPSWSHQPQQQQRYENPLPSKPWVAQTQLSATTNNSSEEEKPKKKRPRKKKKSNKKQAPRDVDDDANSQDGGPTKEDLVKAIGESMRQQQKAGSVSDDISDESDADLFDKLNPFRAGQNLRRTIDDAIKGMATPAPVEDSVYYVGDRLLEDGESSTDSLSLEERLLQDEYVPEVLIVGATGEVGALVVRRLLQDQGRFRVRVLVRDLFTRTLNRLGTGVTYCQGDLNNIDSLEYALTDVDKIIFCASPPRPDEDDFRARFEEYVQENLRNPLEEKDTASDEKSDEKWERLDSILQVRADLAEQVDCIGMKNIISAYQDVRHADYGTSQAAKRTLFKFEGRPEDFNLFSVDMTEDNDLAISEPLSDDEDDVDDDDDDDDDQYSDYYDKYDDDQYASLEEREGYTMQTQVQWLRNRFGHAVFVGRLPKAAPGQLESNGEAAVISSRFRSRADPENGIDLGPSFAGFIARACADGGTYEAFIRTGSYASDGIEYVCEFSTKTKAKGYMKSKNKFTTVRLPFENFKPVARKGRASSVDPSDIPVFRGQDIQYMGFRYRSASNRLQEQLTPGEQAKFYLSLDYIKLYRAQPEPEFVYVSDARIPPIVRNGMVQHEARQLVSMAAPGSEDDNMSGVTLLDDSTLQTATDKDRTEQEVYYKFRGEEILKQSGLSYAVVRVQGYNESPSGEASTIELKSSNDEVALVSRAEVAQVCVSALMDPSALNKSFYVSKKLGKSSSLDEKMSTKFLSLPIDEVV